MMFWLKIIGVAYCGIYSLIFLYLGIAFSIEVWKDHHRPAVYLCPIWRSLCSAGVFYVAAIIFGVLSWIII